MVNTLRPKEVLFRLRALSVIHFKSHFSSKWRMMNRHQSVYYEGAPRWLLNFGLKHSARCHGLTCWTRHSWLVAKMTGHVSPNTSLSSCHLKVLENVILRGSPFPLPVVPVIPVVPAKAKSVGASPPIFNCWVIRYSVCGSAGHEGYNCVYAKIVYTFYRKISLMKNRLSRIVWL